MAKLEKVASEPLEEPNVAVDPETLNDLLEELKITWNKTEEVSFDKDSPWLMAGDSSLTMKTPANNASKWHNDWNTRHAQQLKVLAHQHILYSPPVDVMKTPLKSKRWLIAPVTMFKVLPV